MLKFLMILIVFYHGGNCAIRKSWKTSPNFDAEVPKFTPFENVDVDGKQIEDIREIKTTETATQPSPPVETLKISSKFKMPEKVAESIKVEPKKDFGKFAYETLESSSEEDDFSGEKSNDDEEKEEEEEDVEISSLDANSTQLKVGELVNVTIDSEDNTVNVNLDQNSLKEIFTGNFYFQYNCDALFAILLILSRLIFNDNKKSINFITHSHTGRGKRMGLLERIVPLFILPFLIQSAAVPFIVTSIKLILMKSLFAGKIAILFLLLGALRSHQTSMYMKSFATQQAPFLHRDYPLSFLPERRIETSFDGYKVDGKPEAFIN